MYLVGSSQSTLFVIRNTIISHSPFCNLIALEEQNRSWIVLPLGMYQIFYIKESLIFLVHLFPITCLLNSICLMKTLNVMPLSTGIYMAFTVASINYLAFGQ